MKSDDFDLLCSALAFTAVAITGEKLAKDGAQRAAGLAYLIKEFCRSSAPEAFAALEPAQVRMPESPAGVSGKFEILDRMATAIASLMRENDGCLPQDLVAKGFTPEEVDRHWAMAKALAHVELNMLDS